jgi:hypothetical protein
MQLVTIIGAVALWSNSVIAVPGKMEKKSPVGVSHSLGQLS